MDMYGLKLGKLKSLTADGTLDLELETKLISPVKINRQHWDIRVPQKTFKTTEEDHSGTTFDWAFKWPSVIERRVHVIVWATHFLLFFQISKDRISYKVHHTCFCILIRLENSKRIPSYATFDQSLIQNDLERYAL